MCLWPPSNGIMHTVGCGSANGIEFKLPVCIKMDKSTVNTVRASRKSGVSNITFHFHAFMYPFYCIFLLVHTWHLQRLNLYNIIFNHLVLVFVLACRGETIARVGSSRLSRPECNAAAPHVASFGRGEDKAD